MKNCLSVFVVVIGLLFTFQASAGVSLVTVSEPTEVQLTVYQPADLSLVREHRQISLQQGLNRLRLSWHGLVVDPTSLEVAPWQNQKSHEVRMIDLSFSSSDRNEAICVVESDSGGETPLEVSYLTSGISWEPAYSAILTEDESSLQLESTITLTNHSGKNYENARFSVLTGDTHLVDRLADLARARDPYGRPREDRMKAAPEAFAGSDSIAVKRSLMAFEQAAANSPPEITGEGVSDFFLFSIEGTQSIQNGWSKSLRMFPSNQASVVNLYKYDEQRYGNRPARFITFVNRPGTAGAAPLPGGEITVYRSTGQNRRLCYEGQSKIPYASTGETVELNLGKVTDVIVEPTLLEAATDRYSFDRKGNISGWDEIHTWKLEIYNTRSVPAQMQIDRHASTADWTIDYGQEKDSFEKIDKKTFRFKKTLGAGERRVIEYTITTHHGTFAELRSLN